MAGTTYLHQDYSLTCFTIYEFISVETLWIFIHRKLTAALPVLFYNFSRLEHFYIFDKGPGELRKRFWITFKSFLHWKPAPHLSCGYPHIIYFIRVHGYVLYTTSMTGGGGGWGEKKVKSQQRIVNRKAFFSITFYKLPLRQTLPFHLQCL